MHPTIRVDDVGRLPRLLVVTHHHVAAPDQDLAVLAQLHLHARDGPPDRRRLVRLLRHGGGRPGQLAHAPHLEQREAQGGPELVQLGAARRGGGDGQLAPVQANFGSQQHEKRLRFLDRGGKLGRHGLPIAPQPVRRNGRRNGALHHLAFVLVRLRRDPRVDPRHQLLPHPGHAHEQSGSGFQQELQQRVRVRAQPHLVPREHAAPLRGEPFGDMRQRQVADQRLRLEVPEPVVDRLERPDDVVVRIDHALRRSRRPRRVDQRDGVLRPDGAPRLREGRRIGRDQLASALQQRRPGHHAVAAAVRSVAPDQHHVAQMRRRRADGHELGQEPLVLHERDRGLGVIRHVLDLLRRQRVVDADRRAACVDDAQVGDHVLRRVARHDQPELSRPETQ